MESNFNCSNFFVEKRTWKEKCSAFWEYRKTNKEKEKKKNEKKIVNMFLMETVLTEIILLFNKTYLEQNIFSILVIFYFQSMETPFKN